MANKRFADRLNSQLDEIGVPPQYNERTMILAKLLKTSSFKAASLLDGNPIFATKYTPVLAKEFQVSEQWLLGKSDEKYN